MTEKCEAKKEIEIRPVFLSDIMKLLSELESDVWSNGPTNKVKMQNIIIVLKSQLMQIDKEQKDIITINGFKYKRSWDE